MKLLPEVGSPPADPLNIIAIIKYSLANEGGKYVRKGESFSVSDESILGRAIK